MSLADPGSTITTDMSGATSASNLQGTKNLDSFIIPSKSTDINDYTPEFNKWHGMYREVAEARSTLDVWCKWIIGEELIMNSSTRKLTNRIRGNGLDTFRTILINHKRTSKICGDSFIEIIRDRANRVINLKLLDPSSITVRANNKGIIRLYIQSKSKIVNGVKETQTITFQPEDIWHLANDRIADEIHGISELEKLDKIVKWRQQAMMDMSIVFHRYVKPLLQIKAKTDDPVELAALAANYNNAFKNFENIIIPEGIVDEVERIAIPQFATLDPLPWLIFLRSYFTESSGVPDIIRGKSDEVSLAAGKLNVHSYIQKISMEQLEYSEDCEAQTGLKISFTKPEAIDITSGFGTDKKSDSESKESKDSKDNNDNTKQT